MKKKLAAFSGIFVIIAAVLLAVFWGSASGRLKAAGVLQYSPREAKDLAYRKCSQCHNTDKIAKYCMRCGPPLTVVVHNMRTLVRLERKKGRSLDEMTDAEAVAIAQVWNAVVGNWEETWRKKDLEKLLEGDRALTRLIDTPVEKRPIETALMKLEGRPASMSAPAVMDGGGGAAPAK